MKKLFLAGHNGMVGSAILRAIKNSEIYSRDFEVIYRTKQELDLTDQRAVRQFMQSERPDTVIIAAAKVGGIHANNTYPADFIFDNIMIAFNLISEARAVGVQKLLQLGSSCIYPRSAKQPITEDELLNGKLEQTNEPYAVAKIAAIKLCESINRQYGTDYRSIMPTNLYGPGDNFHPDNSHVVPALISRFHNASINGQNSVTIWGSGKPRREFLHVDDMAAASLFVLMLDDAGYASVTKPMESHINVGTGQDISIIELARMIAEIVGYKGNIITDPEKPDGTPRKLLDISKLTDLGWKPTINLRSGLQQTYEWYLSNYKLARSL